MGIIKKLKNKKDLEKQAMDIKNEMFGINANKENQNEAIENMKQIIESWLDDKFIHSKTELTNNQIIALTELKTIAEKYGVTCIKEIIDNFCRYKLSEGRRSSKELVEILNNRPEITGDQSFIDKFKAFTH